LLICGDNEGLPELCAQLIAFCPAVQIFVMVPEARRIATMARRFATHADGLVDGSHSAATVRFADGGAHLVCRVDDQPLEARVTLLVGDWSRQQTVIAQPERDYRLEQIDAVLLSHITEVDDPDAATSLGLLKLLRLLDGAPAPPRVLCEVRSVEKAELLQRRFGRSASPGDAGPRVTVVPAERVRNALMAQAIFVPGIGEIYQEMLSIEGHEICTLEPLPGSRDNGMLSFGSLLQALYQREQMILVAVELFDEGEGSTRVVVNPAPWSAAARFPARQLRRIFAIGDSCRAGAPDQRSLTA
jgi:hypothetical protein